MKNKLKLILVCMLMCFFALGGLNNISEVYAAENPNDYVIGVNNLNNTPENSAKVGDILKLPEKGWKRYDDADNKITYIDSWRKFPNPNCYNNTQAYSSANGTIKFKFYGTKLRLLGTSYNDRSTNIQIKIDDVLVGTFSQNSITTIYMKLDYEKTDLIKKIHTCEIINGSGTALLDAIDIDSDGYLISDEDTQSISLNKSSLNLLEGNSEKLTATVKPDDAVNKNVTWTSSDESIATVDENGNVKAIKEGQATITATIEGTDIKADCIVTVTKKETPVDPEEPTGDGNLYIEMVDGNIKQAKDIDVNNFIKWFKNRDLDKTESPIYKIKNAKGNVEYLVHDKIVGFEIREY